MFWKNKTDEVKEPCERKESISGKSLDQSEPSENNDIDRKNVFIYKIIRQVILGLIWVSLGLYLEIAGPTLQDLMRKVDSNYEEISYVLVSRSVGFFVGSAVGGVLCDRLHNHVDLILGSALLIAAGSTILSPLSPVIELMMVTFLIQGLCEGTLNAGGNSMCIRIWQEKVAGPMHSMHFGFGIGGALSAQLARPFVAQKYQVPVNSTCTDTMTTTFPTMENSSSSCQVTNQTHQEVIGESTIEYAYLIAGIWTASVGMCFFILYFKKPPKGFKLGQVKDRVDIKLIFYPENCAQDNRVFGFKMFILLFLFYMHVVGGERAWGKFVYSFATDQLKMSIDDATLLNTLFWVFFSIGRFSGIIIAHFVRPQLMVPMEICGDIVCGLVLSFSGYKNLTVLWIFNALLGLFVSPVFPSGVAWSNVYLQMTSVACSVLLLGGASGGLVYQYITGWAFENYGPRSLTFIILAYGISMFVLFSMLQLFAYMQGTIEDNNCRTSEKKKILAPSRNSSTMTIYESGV